MFTKSKGYRVERKIRIMFEQRGWIVIRAGASLGEADLVCLKKGKCILLQVKSTKKDIFYYYGWMEKKFEGLPFYLVVDFGYGKIRISAPQPKMTTKDGTDLREFLYNTSRNI